MYEASFGLKRRPFAATPDATCFLSSEPIQAALDELVICVEDGQGIAVLTAPAGMGKTLLCERLSCELGERYETVLLRHSSFMTRRALLQTVLCELNHSYQQPSEQELRLELFPAIRALRPQCEALVLICDEAHQLSDSLLEELRILADFAEGGRPLVRLVLVGQPLLEEKLAQPGMEAINQRIRAQIYLPPFDHSESLDYIDYRLTWAGGRTEEVFTAEALHLIAEASDGIPRCINQLADHALLLAFVAEQRPAGQELIREALSDLRQLPLHWNEPISSDRRQERSHDHRPSLSDKYEIATVETPSREQPSYEVALPYSFEPAAMTNPETIEIEPDAEPRQFQATEAVDKMEFPIDYSPADFTRQNNEREFTVGSDDWDKTLELFHPHSTVEILTQSQTTARSIATINEPPRMVSPHDPREDFHSLLRDAYEAAGTLPSSNSMSGHVNEDGTSRPDHPLPVDSLNQWPVEIEPVSQSRQQITPPVNSADEFQEEVVVDRYSAIDAGMQPPENIPSDIEVTGEVHQIRQVDRQISELSPIDVTQFIDDFQPVRIEEPITNDIHSSDLTCPPASAVSEEPVITDLVQQVYSLGQSLRPSGSLSSQSDTLLNALRNEMDQPAEVIVPSNSVETTVSATVPVWESIETASVAATVEERPFRYLFSMLRRKQRGMS